MCSLSSIMLAFPYYWGFLRGIRNKVKQRVTQQYNKKLYSRCRYWWSIPVCTLKCLITSSEVLSKFRFPQEHEVEKYSYFTYLILIDNKTSQTWMSYHVHVSFFNLRCSSGTIIPQTCKSYHFYIQIDCLYGTYI